VGFRVGVACVANKATESKSDILILYLLIVSKISSFTYFEVCGQFVGVKVGVANSFWVNR